MADVARSSDHLLVVLQGEGKNEAMKGKEDEEGRKRRSGEFRDDVLHPVRAIYHKNNYSCNKKNRLVNQAFFRCHKNIGK